MELVIGIVLFAAVGVLISWAFPNTSPGQLDEVERREVERWTFGHDKRRR